MCYLFDIWLNLSISTLSTYSSLSVKLNVKPKNSAGDLVQNKIHSYNKNAWLLSMTGILGLIASIAVYLTIVDSLACADNLINIGATSNFMPEWLISTFILTIVCFKFKDGITSWIWNLIGIAILTFLVIFMFNNVSIFLIQNPVFIKFSQVAGGLTYGFGFICICSLMLEAVDGNDGPNPPIVNMCKYTGWIFITFQFFLYLGYEWLDSSNPITVSLCSYILGFAAMDLRAYITNQKKKRCLFRRKKEARPYIYLWITWMVVKFHDFENNNPIMDFTDVYYTDYCFYYLILFYGLYSIIFMYFLMLELIQRTDYFNFLNEYLASRKLYRTYFRKKILLYFILVGVITIIYLFSPYLLFLKLFLFIYLIWIAGETFTYVLFVLYGHWHGDRRKYLYVLHSKYDDLPTRAITPLAVDVANKLSEKSLNFREILDGRYLYDYGNGISIFLFAAVHTVVFKVLVPFVAGYILFNGSLLAAFPLVSCSYMIYNGIRPLKLTPEPIDGQTHSEMLDFARHRKEFPIIYTEPERLRSRLYQEFWAKEKLNKEKFQKFYMKKGITLSDIDRSYEAEKLYNERIIARKEYYRSLALKKK